MNANFSGLEEIAKFAKAIQTFLRDGKREEDGNQPRRTEADGKALQYVRNDSNERRSQEVEVFRKVNRKANKTEAWGCRSVSPSRRL